MNKILCLCIVLVLTPCIWGCKKKTTTTPVPTDSTKPPFVQTTPWPEWIFHHWIWQSGPTTANATQLVNDYASNGIPVSAIILDSGWETDFNTFKPDSTKLPDLQGLINQFHSKNIRVMLWITAIVDTGVHPLYDSAANNHFFMQATATSGPAIVKWWHGYGSLIDLYNPAAIAWMKGMMDTELNMGLDGWKCDGSDYLTVSGNATYSPYLAGNMPSRNDYSNRYYQLFHDYTRQKNGFDRAIMCRPIDNYGYGFGGAAVAFAPPQIGWSCWVGDQDGTFTGLQKALDNMYWSDQYGGYLGFGSDIGGYRTDPNYPGTGRSQPLFMRWAELGTFCGLMENGGGGEHRPWMFDAQTSATYKKFVLLREQMVPYLMKTASQRFSVQKAMMNFFNKTDYSYMLGDDIFVAPILDNTGIVTIHFPAGNNWVYLFDKSKTYNGGTSSSLSVPIDQFPVFLRQGADLVSGLNP